MDEDSYAELYIKASRRHEEVLAVLEKIRLEAEGRNPGLAWAVAVNERLLCAFEFGTQESAIVHNIVVDSINFGVHDCTPPEGAELAYIFMSEDLGREEKDPPAA